MSAEQCETCRFWRRCDSDATFGFCRKSPPVLFIAEGYQPGFNWPDTKPADWCGAWEANNVLQADPPGIMAAKLDAAAIARGCLDYGGGYWDEKELNIFHHGIQTVANALEAWITEEPPSFAVRVLLGSGRKQDPALSAPQPPTTPGK